MKNGFATSSYAARLIEHAARFRDKTGRGKVSTEPVASILAHPGTPILSKMNVESAGDRIYTICHHLNLNPRTLPPIRFIIWLSQPDLNALRPGSFHFWKILPCSSNLFWTPQYRSALRGHFHLAARSQFSVGEKLPFRYVTTPYPVSACQVARVFGRGFLIR